MSVEQYGDDSRGRRMPAIRIPRLKGRSNYLEWAQAVEIHLKAEQCWCIITGELQRPPEPRYNPYTKPISAEELRELEENVPPAAAAAALRLTVIDTEIKRWEVWEGKHQYTIEQVFISVERSIWDCLAHQNDAQALWEEIKETYQKARVPEFMEELTKFHSIKPGSFESTERYGQAIKASYLRLVALKFPFPKELVSFKLLQELKSTFQIKFAQYDGAEVFPDFEQIIEDCVFHERQYGIIGTGKPTAGSMQNAAVQVVTALNEHSKKRKSDANNANKRDPPPKCSECGREHYTNKESICFYKHPEKAPFGWKPAKRFRENPDNQD